MQPNVIVFFTDQQRWDTAGVHGNPLELTPNFDRMAKRGTHLFHSFTNHPVCGPARACLQTGLYGTETGCIKNGNPLPKGQKTLAHYFREAGYRTGYIGKWHLADQEPVPGDQRGGYEYWLGANKLEVASDAYDTVLYNNDNAEVFLPGYRTDALTDASIRYIADHKDSPFFLFLSHIEPHHQNHLDSYPAPAGYEERYTGRWLPADLASLDGSAHGHIGGYYGMVKRLDEALGRLLDALISMRIMDRTIVLFTSDHGCHFKTRQGGNTYKSTCHESAIRIPTALIGPGFNQGGEIRELTGLIDLPPTLLEAAGIPAPSSMQGKSLLPLVQRRCESWPDDVLIQLSSGSWGRAVRTRRWKYGTVQSKAQPGVYEEKYLYDLHADPHELNNLIHYPTLQRVKEEMRSRLSRRMREAGEAEPSIIEAEQKPLTGRHEATPRITYPS